MKLWKKLSGVTIAVLLLMTGVSGTAVVYRTAQYNESKAVEAAGEQLKATAYALGRELSDKQFLAYSEATKHSYLNFLLRKYGASRYILLDESKVLCNLTGYTLVEPDDGRWSGEEASCDIQRGEDRYILIMGRTVPEDRGAGYRLVLVEDITKVYAEIREQALLFAGIFGGAALIALLLVFLLTRRILAPLKELRQAALDISGGSLERRADIRARDEIGELGQAFNKMAEQIDRQVAQLEQVSEQRMQLLGSLTHELKTPMTSIIGYSDTLLHVNLKPESREKALLHIHEECRRLERLSGKLMSLIGLYENESICMEEVEMRELFAQVGSLERYHLEKMGISLETSCSMGKRKLDRDLFESLLMNLIDNAAKASRPGQTVTLEGMEHTVRVRDHGRGIPEAELERVTEAFYMVDKARSKKEGGIGLGLALCSRIAALHSARLVIESREGEGTCVSVCFDVPDAEQ